MSESGFLSNRGLSLQQSPLKSIAAIEDLAVMTKMLAHLSLPTSHLRYSLPATLAVQPAFTCAGVRTSTLRFPCSA